MIVKNEEAMLARCLDSVKDKVDAIYIADTGSTDNTVEIARRYTPNVFLDFVWVDHMAKGFNHINSKVPKEYDFILSIDGDEVLLSTREELYEAAELAKDVVRVTMVAEGDEKNTFGFGRLFRNTPDIFWCKPIHKHLNVPGEGEFVGNVRIMYGRSPAHDRDPDRSLRILEKAVSDDPESARELYYLGREYWYKQRYEDAVDTFKKYLKIAHWAAEVADANFIMGQCYCELKQPLEAANAVLQAILINPNFKEAVQLMAELAIPENQPQWLRMARTATNEGLIWKRVPAEPMPNTIFLSPHQDDETLYGAVTLMREKPLVIICTSSHIQPDRGDMGCTDEIRRQETINAMALIGCPVVFLGIKDKELTYENLYERLKGFSSDRVYAPAIQGGNRHHDIVSQVAVDIFGTERCKLYTTYNSDELHTTGFFEIKPTAEEFLLKNKMLDCYKSQLALSSTLPHFKAVYGKSEWLI